jgi:aspartyl-tRNA(Asn)/glutamyl-tRNA(Gln) amidotransferase subunit A
VDACRIRARLVQSVEKAFEAVDLIVLPVLGNPGATWEKPATISAFYDMF